jgi:hypothetical protein
MDELDDRDRRHRRLELVATIVLALAAVATAWSTYQGSRWRGEQAVDTSRATAARIDSAEASARAGQLTQIDIATFTEWVDATTAGDTALAGFYERRFREEFRPAFGAWLATDPLANPDAPLTPFAMPEYEVAEAQRASRLNREAGARSAAAGRANQHADDFHVGCRTVRDGPVLRGHLGQDGRPPPAGGADRAEHGGLLGGLVWVATLRVSFGQ